MTLTITIPKNIDDTKPKISVVGIGGAGGNAVNTMISQNFYVWPILGKYVWPNYFIGSSHNQEIDFLKGWISQRLNWMDGQINNF